MDLDPVVLSRIQFAFVVAFHIIFPSFTIGLAAWLATVETASRITGNPVYRKIFDFWLKVFALCFGMGVVTGIVMAFQFGTNWGVLAERTGAIQGPLLAYEAFTAFLLEATFFGVVLFGRGRVPPWFYLLSCWMVVAGTTFSSFWILSNNSWMQVPVGHAIVDGKFVPVDWGAIIWGKVFRIRWLHMLLAAYLTTALCVAACGAWYLLRKVHVPEARTMLQWGLGLTAVLIIPQLVIGHLNGEYTKKYQPSKFTAIEGRWHTEQPAALVLFAWPDEARERNRFEVSIPALGSFVDDGSFTAAEPGILTIPKDERPPLAVPFFGFRIMVGLGVLMLLLGWGGCILALTGRLDRSRRFLWLTVLSFPAGFIAVIAGWFTAEMGRQPWVVYGLLRTTDALTPSLSGGDVLMTLIGYVSVYAVIYGFGFYYIFRLVGGGLNETETETEESVHGGTGMRPMAAAGPAATVTGNPLATGE